MSTGRLWRSEEAHDGPGPAPRADTLDDHLAAESAAKDVDATMATMTDDPHPNHALVIGDDLVVTRSRR